MDPDQNLQEQVQLAQRIIRSLEAGIKPGAMEQYRLSELVLSLDGWLKKGGSLPGPWRAR